MEKKVYEYAGIEIVLLGSDMLITSGGTLGEDDWAEFGFNQL